MLDGFALEFAQTVADTGKDRAVLLVGRDGGGASFYRRRPLEDVQGEYGIFRESFSDHCDGGAEAGADYQG